MRAYLCLLQANGFSELQRALRDQFLRSGSVTSTALFVLALGAVVYLTFIVMRRASRFHDRADPPRLFNGLMRELGLTRDHRRMLRCVVRSQKLRHPAVVLLSPKLFDQLTASWRTGFRKGSEPDLRSEDEALASIRATLYPHVPSETDIAGS